MKLDRRAFVIGTGILLSASAPGVAAAGEEPFADAVDAGLSHFRSRAAEQLPLVKALTVALESGNTDAAQAAYIAARPPYEEIEVLALCFAETDTAIDARPYAFDGGESNPDFRGFHRIEALLFADRDLAAALPYAVELEGHVAQLEKDLRNRAAFSAARTFEGMIGLATEIPAKKISSEEETWSDRSLLIFRHNLIGIDSQYRPFAAALAQRDEAVASAVSSTFTAAMAAVDTVFGADPGGAPYSGIKIAERRAIAGATSAFRDALRKSAERLELA